MTIVAAFVSLISGTTIHSQGLTTRISMSVGDAVISAILEDNETPREFVATLPWTMSMTHYDDREYYGKVGRRLSGLIRMGRILSDLSLFSGLPHNMEMRITIEEEYN